ncbi:MAG: 16S rRNA (guanine(966)-N(2))-methyltransferase RsmD [Candidatus Omnitrophica bacterium]|nr:16S rRNA (guanine(966)-N(2))-methyltransferase RsmD [Candidatus Omnitrophota bacterium]
MRIIAGIHRGRKIKGPPSELARPTKDRIRESVFNIIAPEVPGSTVLDIFAGSGAYGLEALSRGAKSAAFVEKDETCASVLEENVHILALEDQVELIIKDAFDALELMGPGKKQFDLIFADPPYNINVIKKTLIMINHYDILNPTGLLIMEHSASEDIPDIEENVSILKQKTYGNIVVSIYQKQ